MALSVKESGETSLDHARKASQEIQEGNLDTAKVALAKAEMSAGKHLKMIQYQIERYTAVQDHYKQQEKDLTTKINSVLETERSLESQKSSAEIQLSYERNEWSRYQSDLSSAEDRLRDAERRKSNAKTGKVLVCLAVGISTAISFGAAAPFAIPAAVGGATPFIHAEKDAEDDIRRCRGRIEDTERKIRQIENNISSLSSRISQLSNEKSKYMSQRSRLQEEKGRIKNVIAFLQDAQRYGGEYSISTEHSINQTALTGRLVSKAETKGYSLFDSRGTERVLNSFKEAWEAFEEMNEEGNNYKFETDFQCTRCSSGSHEFPHVKDGQLICSICHDTLEH